MLTIPKLNIQGRSQLFHIGQAKVSIHFWSVYRCGGLRQAHLLKLNVVYADSQKSQTITNHFHLGEFFLLSSGTSFTDLYNNIKIFTIKSTFTQMAPYSIVGCSYMYLWLRCK